MATEKLNMKVFVKTENFSTTEVNDNFQKIDDYATSNDARVLEVERAIDDIVIPSVDGLATKVELTDAQATTLASSKTYTDEEIDKIVIPSIDGLATTEYVDNSIATLTNLAPETLDTFKEVADVITSNEDAITLLETSILNKVDKVEDKGLSTNDLTDELLTKYDGYDSRITDLDNTKVDKVAGKTLTTIDFTAEKNTKLDGIEAGAQVNPNMTLYSTKEEIEVLLNTKENRFSLGDRLSFVAPLTESEYRKLTLDLTNIPYANISGTPVLKTDLNQFDNVDGFIKGSELHSVATSGDYRQLTNRPLNLSEFSNTATAFINNSVNNLINYYTKEEVYTKTQVEELLATSFTYSFVDAVPTVETAVPFKFYFVRVSAIDEAPLFDQYLYDVDLDQVVKVGTTEINLEGYVTTELLNTTLASYVLATSLSTVATSGEYDDLNNRPNIPDIIANGIVENDIPNKTFVAENYEPKIVTKNTAYNKNFGLSETDVAQGSVAETNRQSIITMQNSIEAIQLEQVNQNNAIVSVNEKFSNTANLVGTLADGTTVTIQVVTIPTATPTPTE